MSPISVRLHPLSIWTPANCPYTVNSYLRSFAMACCSFQLMIGMQIASNDQSPLPSYQHSVLMPLAASNFKLHEGVLKYGWSRSWSHFCGPLEDFSARFCTSVKCTVLFFWEIASWCTWVQMKPLCSKGGSCYSTLGNEIHLEEFIDQLCFSLALWHILLSITKISTVPTAIHRSVSQENSFYCTKRTETLALQDREDGLPLAMYCNWIWGFIF